MNIGIWILSAGCLFQCDIEGEIAQVKADRAAVQYCVDNPDDRSANCEKVLDANTEELSLCLDGYREYCTYILTGRLEK